MRTIDQEGIDHIKQWEKLRLLAYKPTVNDKWTIGWGHTRTAREGKVITEAKAEDLLREDLDWVERAVNNRVHVYLTQNQYNALCSFVYNIGEQAFITSTLLELLNDEKYNEVPTQLMRWNKQTKPDGSKEEIRGLTRRRASEIALWGRTQAETELAHGAPTAPEGRTKVAILKESKTAKVGTGLALSGSAGLITEVGQFQGIIDSLQGASPYFYGALLIAGCWFVYNRWLDSKKGRAV